MEGNPQGSSDSSKKIVQAGFYITAISCALLLFALLEITDDNPNVDRIGFISSLVIFLIGFGIIAISMGLMTYALSNDGDLPMVRAAAILAATYLLAQFLGDFNPLNLANDLLSGTFSW